MPHQPDFYHSGVYQPNVAMRVLGMVLCFAALLTVSARSNAQNATPPQSEFHLTLKENGRVTVKARFADAVRRVSFVTEYAGANRLDARIENLRFGTPVSDAERTPSTDTARGASVQTVGRGVFQTDVAEREVSYEAVIPPRGNVAEGAHVSWLDSERGLLMLYDLLPRVQHGARIKIAVPSSWQIYASVADATTTRQNDLRILSFTASTNADWEDEVIYAGADVRALETPIDGGKLRCLIGGKWALTDREILDATQTTLNEHQRTVGSVPRGRASVMLAPFPQNVAAHRWSAETRGANTLILSGFHNSKLAARNAFENILAHEVFHLWMPHGLNLAGEYAWFYEGFTLYQALLVNVRHHALTFDELLGAIGRATEIYELAEQRSGQQLSLLKSSQARWANAPVVYSKALVAACVYDLSVRAKTNNRASLKDVYKLLLRAHHRNAPRAEANQAVINALDTVFGNRDFTQRYVVGSDDLTEALSRVGLSVTRTGATVKVGVKNNLNDNQKKIFARLRNGD